MARRVPLRIGLVAGLLFAGSTGPHAQTRLSQATKLECTFTLTVVANWKNGPPEAVLKPSTLKMTFDEVNPDEGSARVVGLFGPSDIIVRLSGETLTLIQSFREGPLYSTTVFPKERNGRFQAVHSRHELTDVALPGYTSSPEQYYGECQASR